LFRNLFVFGPVLGFVCLLLLAARAWLPLTEGHGNNYDHFTAEFHYPNGVISISQCRHFQEGLYTQVGELVIGARGRSNCRDLADRGKLAPKVQEHADLVRSIRGEGPYINLAMQVAETTMTAIMARESAYSGMAITWDQIMKSELNLMPPNLEQNPKLGLPAPPAPGEYKFI